MPMGANYGDLDNDGWLDFYLGTGNPSVKMTIPNRVFRNDRGNGFLDITTNGGLAIFRKDMVFRLPISTMTIPLKL